ncbi:hypothetical protein I4U23_010675 [Adineta vaga]|nr:hypothetical protein I4U23_010675 [Adineta vaga]
MYLTSISLLLLPVIDSLVTVQIHRYSVYQPHSPCAFLSNATWSNEVSIQSCIWQCVEEYDCQTAI